MDLIRFISLCVQIWLCQNLVKFNNQFVKLLLGPQRQTCLFQIKRILGFCCRYSAKILGDTEERNFCFQVDFSPSVSKDSYSAAGTTV